MNKIETKIERTATKLLQLFVERKYSQIAGWSKSVRLTADEIKEEIEDYGNGQKVIIPPTIFFNEIDFMQIVDTDDGRKQWSVIFELWMEEEGKSDLSVELFFIESTGEYFDIELNNIHVM